MLGLYHHFQAQEVPGFLGTSCDLTIFLFFHWGHGDEILQRALEEIFLSLWKNGNNGTTGVDIEFTYFAFCNALCRDGLRSTLVGLLEGRVNLRLKSGLLIPKQRAAQTFPPPSQRPADST